MVTKQIIIDNFRCIKHADIRLGKDTLLAGTNNAGKSTFLEALDLALGPDRLNSLDAICEHDFYKNEYIDDQGNPIKIQIECRFVGLNEKQKRLFSNHLEYWNLQKDGYVAMGDIPEDPDPSIFELSCLRIKFEAFYDKEEDEFVCSSFYPHPPLASEDESPHQVSKKDKRELGYLYLRFLRTGTRALSLERGSLLDIVLSLKEIKHTSWKKILENLTGVGNPLGNDTNFRDVLQQIECKVKNYIPLAANSSGATKFEVTNLTRKDIKQSMNLFIGTGPGDFLAPYRNVGNGTVNVFLFSLMCLIADLKKKNDKNVIFAMEEPEIAIAPYTQRRIINEIFNLSNQSILTTHSPYVTERFIGKTIMVLKNNGGASLDSRPVDFTIIKDSVMRSAFRTRFAEGLLSKGVIAVEGVSDDLVLYQVADKLAEFDQSYTHPDVQGLIIINNSGSGNLNSTGKFFMGAGIKSYAFYDQCHDTNNPVDEQNFSSAKQHNHNGMEELLVEEIPAGILTKFLTECVNYPDYPNIQSLPVDEKQKALKILKARKAEGYGARLINLCQQRSDLPATIAEFLKGIQNDLDPSPAASDPGKSH